MPSSFNGKLNQNFMLSGIFNMIISQTVFANNIDLPDTLVSLFRKDGTMYGDTKLYYATDVGVLWDFKDNGGKTLLTKLPPRDPKVQKITIDTFKQTGITIDGTLLKQAFYSSDIYGQFCSVTLQWLRDTKRVLDVKLINSYVGTVETEAENAVITVDLPERPNFTNVTELNQWLKVVGGLVGEAIGNVAIDLKDAGRKYNEYKFLRAYDLGQFILVWNKRFDTLISHLSLPQIFHEGKTLDMSFRQEVINDIYFGDVIEKEGTVGEKEEIRTLVPMTVGETWETQVQYFPSDILPEGTHYNAGEAYRQHSDFTDDTIICKLIHKEAIPFMSAMMVETEFFNPMDLDRNHYLTWGYSKPDYLSNYPIVTFKAKFVD